MTNVFETNQLWYRRTFAVPSKWRGKRVLLNFGAVDWQANVRVNGKWVGEHHGGSEGVTFDTTDALNAKGDNEIVVAVLDPTDAGPQPRGKQVRKPGGIWYTPTSGIWQTVWLEPVRGSHLSDVKFTPDTDRQMVTINVNGRFEGSKNSRVLISVYEGKSKITGNVLIARWNDAGKTGRQVISLPKPKLWSPESPFLYTAKLRVEADGKITDEIESYFAMRKISMARDDKGRLRMQLNNTNY